MKIESKKLSISDESPTSEHISLDYDTPEKNSPIEDDFPLSCNKKINNCKGFILGSVAALNRISKKNSEETETYKETIEIEKENVIHKKKQIILFDGHNNLSSKRQSLEGKISKNLFNSSNLMPKRFETNLRKNDGKRSTFCFEFPINVILSELNIDKRLSNPNSLKIFSDKLNSEINLRNQFSNVKIRSKEVIMNRIN